MLISETFRDFLKNFLLRKWLWRLKSLMCFAKTGHWSSLKFLKICKKEKKGGSLKALYKRRRWVGVLLLKILEETSTIGSAFHRWMRGT